MLRTGLRRDTRSVEVIVGEADGAVGWARLDVRTAEGAVCPGWWRRAGSFLVTVAGESAAAGARSRSRAPAISGRAAPVHSWVDRPQSG